MGNSHTASSLSISRVAAALRVDAGVCPGCEQRFDVPDVVYAAAQRPQGRLMSVDTDGECVNVRAIGL
jgi:hypothetical protein